MASFNFLIDLIAFEGCQVVCDYRINGTVYEDGQHSFDEVEVLGTGPNLSWDGWRTIKNGHPLFGAARRYLDTKDAAEQARLAIRDAMEGVHPPPRQSFLIYCHQTEAAA